MFIKEKFCKNVCKKSFVKMYVLWWITVNANLVLSPHFCRNKKSSVAECDFENFKAPPCFILPLDGVIKEIMHESTKQTVSIWNAPPRCILLTSRVPTYTLKGMICWKWSVSHEWLQWRSRMLVKCSSKQSFQYVLTFFKKSK